MACGPDVIFIGGWLAGSYDALSQIAPVVYLATDSDLGVVESVRQNTRAIASLFGLEDTAGELMTGFDSRVAALASFSEGRTAIVWAWLPAAASMCWATTAAAPSSAGKRALPTWGRTPSPAPPPTATRPASSSSWTRTRLSLCSGPGCRHWHRWGQAGPGSGGERADEGHRRLPGRQDRLPGPSRRVVHRRGRHHRAGSDAPGS